MTITSITQILPRLWTGSLTPGLPVGMYVGQATVTGDGSGGNMRLIWRFRTEAGPVSGRFFNLEQLNVRLTNAGGGRFEASFRTDGFDRVGNVPMFDRTWATELEGTSLLGESALKYGRLPQFPVFLGQTDLTPGGSSSLFFDINNTNSAVMEGQIQGYIWEPRSTNAVGGLGRPVEALYG